MTTFFVVIGWVCLWLLPAATLIHFANKVEKYSRLAANVIGGVAIIWIVTYLLFFLYFVGNV